MMDASAFHGIHGIVYALFNADEKLDRAAMRRQVACCLASGVHGMAALGLATEVSKLSFDERVTVMEWTAEDVAGRVPLGFTIFGGSVAEQIAQVRAAENNRADWVILQPPMVGSFAAGEYIAFFGRIAEATHLPVGIQNAPAYMGRGLTADEIAELVTRYPYIRLLKGEGPATDIRGVIERTAGRVPVFNGRGGLELIDNLRAGCAGLILAPDVIDHAVHAYDAYRAGDIAEAERIYQTILPAIVFVMQSVESLICYGKRLFAARAGLIVHDRGPALRPSAFGLELVERFARELGRLT
jgi:4-hydroxy-tetrahydrodipicolinate synthase